MLNLIKKFKPKFRLQVQGLDTLLRIMERDYLNKKNLFKLAVKNIFRELCAIIDTPRLRLTELITSYIIIKK